MYAKVSTDGVWTMLEGIPDLDDLYREVVTDTVEVLNLDPLSPDGQDAVMWLSETGKLDGAPRNEVATRIALEHSGIAREDYIAGNAVFTGGPDEEGETQGLSAEWFEFLGRIRDGAVVPA